MTPQEKDRIPGISHHLPLTLPPRPQLVRLPGQALEHHVGLQTLRGGTAGEVSRPDSRVEGGGGRPEHKIGNCLVES